MVVSLSRRRRSPPPPPPTVVFCLVRAFVSSFFLCVYSCVFGCLYLPFLFYASCLFSAPPPSPSPSIRPPPLPSVRRHHRPPSIATPQSAAATIRRPVKNERHVLLFCCLVYSVRSHIRTYQCFDQKFSAFLLICVISLPRYLSCCV